MRKAPAWAESDSSGRRLNSLALKLRKHRTCWRRRGTSELQKGNVESGFMTMDFCLHNMSDRHQWCLEGVSTYTRGHDGCGYLRQYQNELGGVVGWWRRGLVRITDVVNDVFNEEVPKLGRIRFYLVIREQDLMLQRMNCEMCYSGCS